MKALKKTNKIKQIYNYYRYHILTTIIVLLPIINSLLMYDKDNIKEWLSNFHIYIFQSTIILLVSILIYTCNNNNNSSSNYYNKDK